MAIRRLIYELRSLSASLAKPDLARYLLAIGLSGAAILAAKKLEPADRRMVRPSRFKTWGGRGVVLDCAEMDRVTASFDGSSAFTLARELYGRNVYLRAFKEFRAPEGVVIDLGANRGLFCALAAAAIGPKKIVAVEPERQYDSIFHKNVDQFPVEVTLIPAIVGTEGKGGAHQIGASIVPMSEVAATGGLPISFLKIDIEGAEEKLFSGAAPWLEQVERIALEVHPEFCDTENVFRHIKKNGFLGYAADQFGQPTSPDRAMFFYFARRREYLKNEMLAA